MNPFDLTGRTALVTGGNGGIGLAIATGLARAGARLVIAARDAANAEAALATLAEAGAKAAFVPFDAADPQSCREAMAQGASMFGGLDILVCNAGMSIRKLPEELSEAEWRQVLAVNLDAPFFCAQAAFPFLRDAGRGKIINLGSVYSSMAAPKVAAYAASKGGVVQLTRALASAWAPHGIQVNAIIPGWVDTELTVRARIDVAGLDDSVVARTPAGRWGLPQDLAGAAVFLASSASDFITGTTLEVDGGYLSRG